jgi:aminoglycoside phosphotransferase (APT) family kinase protein
MKALADLVSLPIWPDPPQVEPIAAGRTNRNFRVRSGGREYFARLGSDIPRHGIRRSVERRVSKYAATLGIAPAVAFSGGGALVCDYVAGHAWSQYEQRSNDDLVRLGQMLHILHSAPPIRGLPAFDPVSVCRRYLLELKPRLLPEALRQRIEQLIAEAPCTTARCIVHGDLIPENVIDEGARLWLVDWEYAGLGEPETDLAMVVANFGLSDSRISLLLQSHGSAEEAKVRSLALALAAREALWCLRETQAVGPRADLDEYREGCLQRLERLR